MRHRLAAVHRADDDDHGPARERRARAAPVEESRDRRGARIPDPLAPLEGPRRPAVVRPGGRRAAPIAHRPQPADSRGDIAGGCRARGSFGVARRAAGLAGREDVPGAVVGDAVLRRIADDPARPGREARLAGAGHARCRDHGADRPLARGTVSQRPLSRLPPRRLASPGLLRPPAARPPERRSRPPLIGDDLSRRRRRRRRVDRALFPLARREAGGPAVAQPGGPGEIPRLSRFAPEEEAVPDGPPETPAGQRLRPEGDDRRARRPQPRIDAPGPRAT